VTSDELRISFFIHHSSLIIHHFFLVMLDIQVIINTPLEEVFNFKCLAASDQNLEIRLRNDGGNILNILSYCDFIGDGETMRVNYLYPQGPQKIVPGDAIAFYCYMDENRFKTFRQIVIYDSDGRSYFKKI